MSLQGSISVLQEALEKLYLDLEQRFISNPIIRNLWNAMAHDITQQGRSMGQLPQSFWNKFKDEQENLSRIISETLKQTIDIKEDKSLKELFDHALAFEEPAILRIYAPIISKLRENWTGQSLDFYIMVKAHLARINRDIRAFAGDPATIQRSNLLLQNFEKEVQEPKLAAQPPIRKGSVAKTAKPHKKTAGKTQKKVPAKKASALSKRAKVHRRAKPIVEKISLQRRRVRR